MNLRHLASDGAQQTLSRCNVVAANTTRVISAYGIRSRLVHSFAMLVILLMP